MILYLKKTTTYVDEELVWHGQSVRLAQERGPVEVDAMCCVGVVDSRLLELF